MKERKCACKVANTNACTFECVHICMRKHSLKHVYKCVRQTSVQITGSKESPTKQRGNLVCIRACLHPLARTIQSIPALTPSHIQRQRRHRGSHRNTHPDTPTYLRSSTPASSIPAVQARSREHMLKGREGPGILMRAARMNFTVLTAF
jgi:hypothetical protein